MAMLAEPRRKQKYSVNPRGTEWSKDDNKFGQKLLEKMGWNKGKGLGAKEDGRIEHVGIKFKADNKGVGCTNKYADKWIEHQDDFNDLLQSLNQNQTEEADNREVASLEDKSQKLRSRVHYMKFTKGKDLSSRSREDLDCIFGTKKHKKKRNVSEIEEKVEEITTTDNTEVENNHGVQTFTNSFSIQEYFALKMKQRKQPVLEENSTSSHSDSVSKSDEETQCKEDEVDDIINCKNNSLMKRKHVSFNLDYQVFDGNAEEERKNGNIYSDEKTERRKKKKLKEEDQPVEEGMSCNKQECEASDTSKVKVKKSKKEKKKITNTKELNQPVEEEMVSNEEFEASDSSKVKENKSERKNSEAKGSGDCGNSTYLLEIEENSDILTKKSKRKITAEKQTIEDLTFIGQTSVNETIKKKKKKSKHKEVECNGMTGSVQKPVKIEYHAIEQQKWKCSESFTSEQVETICKSFKGADIHKIVGYLNSGPVATEHYS